MDWLRKAYKVFYDFRDAMWVAEQLRSPWGLSIDENGVIHKSVYLWDGTEIKVY